MTELDLIDIGSILPTYLRQIMFQNTMFRFRGIVKCLQHHLILFFCALPMIKEVDLLMARYLAAVLLYFVFFVILCAFDLGNIWPLGRIIHDIKLKRFVSISPFDSTISCGVGGHLLRVCVSQSELWIIYAVVFIATDLGIPAPDAHALINSYNKFESLEKRNSVWLTNFLATAYECQLISKFSL